jgi:hypothetical protein
MSAAAEHRVQPTGESGRSSGVAALGNAFPPGQCRTLAGG